MLVLCSAGSFLHSRMQAISYCTYPTIQCRFSVIMYIRGLVSYREIPKIIIPFGLSTGGMRGTAIQLICFLRKFLIRSMFIVL